MILKLPRILCEELWSPKKKQVYQGLLKSVGDGNKQDLSLRILKEHEQGPSHQERDAFKELTKRLK